MTLDSIQLAIFERVKVASDLLPIKYEAKDFDHNDDAYAELIISPAETQPETIDGGDTLSGIIQFNVYPEDNAGAMAPAKEGQKFLNLFPRNTYFDGVRIKKTGTIRKPVKGKNDKWFTPVLIRYEADSCSM